MSDNGFDYIAVDIGCIECGEPSAIIGVYVDKQDAELAADLAAKNQAKNWRGEHRFYVWQLPIAQGRRREATP